MATKIHAEPERQRVVFCRMFDVDPQNPNVSEWFLQRLAHGSCKKPRAGAQVLCDPLFELRYATGKYN